MAAPDQGLARVTTVLVQSLGVSRPAPTSATCSPGRARTCAPRRRWSCTLRDEYAARLKVDLASTPAGRRLPLPATGGSQPDLPRFDRLTRPRPASGSSHPHGRHPPGLGAVPTTPVLSVETFHALSITSRGSWASPILAPTSATRSPCRPGRARLGGGVDPNGTDPRFATWWSWGTAWADCLADADSIQLRRLWNSSSPDLADAGDLAAEAWADGDLYSSPSRRSAAWSSSVTPHRGPRAMAVRSPPPRLSRYRRRGFWRGWPPAPRRGRPRTPRGGARGAGSRTP